MKMDTTVYTISGNNILIMQENKQFLSFEICIGLDGNNQLQKKQCNSIRNIDKYRLRKLNKDFKDF